MVASVIAAVQLVSADRVSAEPWSLQTSLSVTGTFDDNVALAAENEERDLVTTFSPAVRVTRHGERVTFSARYQTNVALYSRRQNFNNISHTGQTNLTVTELGLGIFQHAQLDISEAFTYTERLIDFPAEGEAVGNEGVITEPNDTWRNRASATLTLPFTTGLSGVVSYTNGITIFKDSALIDTINHNMRVSLQDQLTDRTAVSATYSFQLFDFDGERQVNHALSTGITSTLTPTLEANLSVGATYRPETRRTDVIGAASATKQFQYTQASVSYSRQTSSGGGMFQEPVISQSVALRLVRAMGDRATARLSGSYRDSRSTGTESNGLRGFQIGAAVDYDVTQWLRATTAYGHMAQQATGASGTAPNIRRNTITLTLNGTWQRPIP